MVTSYPHNSFKTPLVQTTLRRDSRTAAGRWVGYRKWLQVAPSSGHVPVPPPESSPAATQQPLERVPELRAKDGVDDGVERGVEVAQPEEQRHDELVEVAVLADGLQDGHDEEGQPAHDEGTRDDGQRLGRLPLPLRVHGLLLTLGVGMVLRRLIRAAGQLVRRRGVRLEAVGEGRLLRRGVVGRHVGEGGRRRGGRRLGDGGQRPADHAHHRRCEATAAARGSCSRKRKQASRITV